MLNLESFRPIYQAFLESGKTVCQFCADYLIKESCFYHWQSKLREEAAINQSGEFLPVSIHRFFAISICASILCFTSSKDTGR